MKSIEEAGPHLLREILGTYPVVRHFKALIAGEVSVLAVEEAR